MKLRLKTILVSAIGTCSLLSAYAQAAGNLLTGDTRLACEAIMCLASTQRPHECNPAIQRYLGINFKKPGDTARARIVFLNQCPASNQSPEMQAFVMTLAQGSGQCDAESINRINAGYDGTIRDVMPSDCRAYAGNTYTGGLVKLPRYVGVPARGGYWVEQGQYEQALAQYNARVQKEDYDRMMRGDVDRGYVPAGGS